MSITIIKNPWRNKFIELVKSATKSIQITSPYVKKIIVDDLYNHLPNNVSVELITSFKLMNYYRGASDLSALEYILNKNGRVYNYQELHAKIYIFDKKKVIVSSGNMTIGGLEKNYEYGILLEGELVNNIIKDYNILIKDKLTGEVTQDIINTAIQIVSNAPKESPIILPNISIENVDAGYERYSGGIDSIIKNLFGWKLHVFMCLVEIPKETFVRKDVNKFAARLGKMYPNNNHVIPKIGQQLQYLRDLGLLQFLGRGVYKKLWL